MNVLYGLGDDLDCRPNTFDFDSGDGVWSLEVFSLGEALSMGFWICLVASRSSTVKVQTVNLKRHEEPGRSGGLFKRLGMIDCSDKLDDP